MIIVRLAGGLGNQLFQYAFGLAMAENKKTNVLFDKIYVLRDKKRGYRLNEFKLKIKRLPLLLSLLFFLWEKFIPNKKFFYTEENVYKYDNTLEHKKNIIYNGYWQSFKYFSRMRSKLKKEICLKKQAALKKNSFYLKIKNTNSVALHVRRGDYCNAQISDIYQGDICTLNYYYNAIKKINNKVKKPIYFIFSDDINWVKDNLKISQKHYFVEGINNELKEFELMKNCKHYIIANSSFSWWAAWLGEKKESIVIAPLKWINKTNNDFNDLLPVNWRRLA